MRDKNKNQLAKYSKRDWTSGKILNNLFGLSWPLVITESFAILVITVDYVWLGRLGSEAIAAVGIASMLMILMMSSIVGLMTGLRAMISRSYGAGDIDKANYVLRQMFVATTLLSGTVSIILVFSVDLLLRFFPGLGNTPYEFAAIYLIISFAGLVGFNLRILMDTAMQASGDTITPMKITFISRFLHLVFAPLLILGIWGFPEMGVAGAALVNILSHTLAGLIGCYILYKGRNGLRFSLRGFKLDIAMIISLLKIGLPAMIMAAQRSIAEIVLARLMIPFGTVAVAAHSIVHRIDTLLFLPNWAISVSAGILVGQNLGAKQPKRAEKSAWSAVGIVAGIMGLAIVAILIFNTGIAGIFTTETDLIATGATFLLIAIAGYAVMPFVIVFTQSISGAGDTIPPMIISLLMVWVVQIPLATYLPHVLGLAENGLRWAIVIGNMAGALAYVTYFLSGRWKRKII